MPLSLRKNTERPDFSGEFLPGIVGKSPPIMEVASTIRKLAKVDIPVLILGESGTGKELAARAIHGLSAVKSGPFIAINCGAIPENLMESELFGFEKGAFTGADAPKRGKIEYAHRGTLFLDEVAELPPGLQVKLLRFLQEKTLERVGGTEPRRVDTRVIAATNRDLASMVKGGTFRADLYYRLAVVNLSLPPLRERGADLLLLALTFVKRYSREYKKDIKGFEGAAVTALKDHKWPGNVRELENRVKKAVALCAGREITAADLALDPALGRETRPLAEAKEEFERCYIKESLVRNKGVVKRTAEELGVSRQHLTNLIRKYGLEV